MHTSSGQADDGGASGGKGVKRPARGKAAKNSISEVINDADRGVTKDDFERIPQIVMSPDKCGLESDREQSKTEKMKTETGSSSKKNEEA